jgi:hypothetical protein
MSDFAPRDCGTCIACCRDLNIDHDGFKKPAGETCPHCTGTGCGIYQTRPGLCRDYFCGWQQLTQLGDDWRPDRSGGMLMPVKGLEGFASPEGMEFLLVGGAAALARPGFAEYVALLVSRRVAVFLSIGGGKALLNPYVEGRDIAQVRAVLLQLHAGATTHRDSPTLPPL